MGTALRGKEGGAGSEEAEQVPMKAWLAKGEVQFG